MEIENSYLSKGISVTRRGEHLTFDVMTGMDNEDGYQL